MAKVKGRQVVLEHLGTAHSDAELAVLMHVAHEHLRADGQLEFDLADGKAAAGRSPDSPVVRSQVSRILWDVLSEAYSFLGFDAVGDEAFKQLVLARLIEPASKVETIRILEEIGVAAPHISTVKRCLGRINERDYRQQIAAACHTRALSRGTLALCLYDVTTLYFEAEKEDAFRKVGYSKERRVDPQIVVGLLVDSTGFPLQIEAFEGNKAETHTLLPVLNAYRQTHGLTDLIVVADAGMLSASNLDALTRAGYRFIVGSRLSKAPYDLQDHFEKKGTFFTDGQILETSRKMGDHQWRVVYQYSAKRFVRDNRTINLQEGRAIDILEGRIRPKNARFLTTRGAKRVIDEAAIQQARDLSGLKGYVTSIPKEVMSGTDVIGSYHALWQVEKSFRMAKTDLPARPMFHHTRGSIDAHLTIVFTALAIARHLQDATGLSIRKLVRTLRPLRDVTITIGGHELTAGPDINPEAREILDQLPGY